ncbi:MAG: hypothetical protein ACI80N_003177, partial [Gammaproteobacteria bacterium]
MKKHSTAWLVTALLAASCSDSGHQAAHGSRAGGSAQVPPVGELVAEASRSGWSSDAAWPGFTLVAPLKSRWVQLVDMSGTAVHAWETGGTPGVAVYLTERGTLLRCIEVEDHKLFTGGGQGGRVQELDWDSSVLWEFEWDSESGLQHHDIEEMPNGNILIIAWDRKTRAEALARGRDPELLEGEEFWPGAVYEIEPTRPVGGTLVWSWHAWDHLVQSFDESAPEFGDPAAHPERIDINGDRDPEPPSDAQLAREAEQMAALGYAGDDDDDGDSVADGDADGDEEEEDPVKAALEKRTKNADWMHTNGIDYNPQLNQIVLSLRRFDEIWIIDHSTTHAQAATSSGGRSGRGGDLLYRWGNPYAYGMGEWKDRQLFGQHNVQWIPDGNLGQGNLIVFNNGAHRFPEPEGQDEDDAPEIDEWSSVDEWWPARDAEGHYARPDGEPFGPSAPTWRYEAKTPTDFFSSFISGVQRLPNGNTLVCAGAPGHVFEVTPDERIVWDWKNPYGLDPGADEPEEDGGADPCALFRAERFAADHPSIVALRERGAPIPLDAGMGPATNQRVDEEQD